MITLEQSYSYAKLLIDQIKIIARNVYNFLGSGFSEDVYEKAMEIDFRMLNIDFENQRTIEIKYKNHHIGIARPDFIIHSSEGDLIIELKAISGQISAPERRQVKNYMRILHILNGIIINFQQPGRRNDNPTELEIVEV